MIAYYWWIWVVLLILHCYKTSFSTWSLFCGFEILVALAIRKRSDCSDIHWEFATGSQQNIKKRNLSLSSRYANLGSIILFHKFTCNISFIRHIVTECISFSTTWLKGHNGGWWPRPEHFKLYKQKYLYRQSQHYKTRNSKYLVTLVQIVE